MTTHDTARHALTADQLAAEYGRCNDNAVAATTTHARTFWCNRRAFVAAEAARRGLTIRRSFTGAFMCGAPADFLPSK